MNQVEGVGHQLHPRRGRDSQRRGERLRGKGRHSRSALPAQQFVGLLATPKRDLPPPCCAGVCVGWMHHAPLIGEDELVAPRLAFARLGLRGQREQASSVEVSDLDAFNCCHPHMTTQPGCTDRAGGSRLVPR